MLASTMIVLSTVLLSSPKFLSCHALESSLDSNCNEEFLHTKTLINKRSILTFPPQSIFQITMGITLAGEVERNSAAIVLAMQQNANLPNESLPLYFPPTVVTARKSSIYEHLKYLFNKYGYNGSECLKKMICQASENPLIGGLLEEIITFVLSPTKHRNIAVGIKGNQTEEDKEIQLILESEKLGKSGGNCSLKFSQCPRTPLDAISTYFHL